MKDLKLMTIERKIKNEYALIFKPESKYWIPFKQMADYYFEEDNFFSTKRNKQ